MSAANVQPIPEDAEAVRRAATMILGHMKTELEELIAENRALRELLATEFTPLENPHLHEFRRADDCRPEYTVTVQGIRIRKFNNWPETKAYMQAVREDRIMSAVKQEKPING